LQPASVEQAESQLWKIRFAPGPELMRRGSDPLLLLRELGQLGALAARPSMGSIPALSEIDPERCYLEWEMTLATAAGRDAIRDVFIFVEDDCELSLEQEAASQPEKVKTDAAPEADKVATGLEEKRGTGGRRSYDKPENATTLRVPAAKLDQFVDLVGELVTVQARLNGIAAAHDDAEISEVAEEIERLTSALRETSMSIRMLPIRATFEKFRRLVHDLARDLGKDVELTIEGAETELDKTVIDQLGDPLMHLIRNSMDHGIEPPDERERRGKARTAKIHLAARHAGASVLISVSDDGRGIDAEAVRTRAVERGLVVADAVLSKAEINALIFRPGFSTARKVTDVSGRGVGMDVVRQRVDGLRGTIEVDSEFGAGTSVVLRLPLTLAIIDGLLVSVGEARFVLPLAATLECIELTRADVERTHGRHVVNVRDEVIPYIRLREQFRIGDEELEREQIMVVETASGHCGIVVDQVLGDCQTVIKNLGSFYRHVQVVSGATILGDGTVALILDPERLVQDAQSSEARRRTGRHPETRGAAKAIHEERSAGAAASA
jgi:two-component system chemotaxis sensor kinase CheA